MVEPILSCVALPVFNSQLSVGHAHCLQILLDPLESVLVGRVR